MAFTFLFGKQSAAGSTPAQVPYTVVYHITTTY